jgi:uncharacterized Tic20 family protein
VTTLVCPLAWVLIILAGTGYFLSDRIIAMILIKSQVISFVWIIITLAILVLALLAMLHLKQRKGGDDNQDE